MSSYKNDEVDKTIALRKENSLEEAGVPVACFRKLTGSGRSAIAVLMLQGQGAESIIEHCFKPANQVPFERGQIRYGLWSGAGRPVINDTDRPAYFIEHPAESVVITPLADETFEIHCHGGPAAVARIEADMRTLSAIPASDASGLKRPQDPLIVHEAENVLLKCITPRTAAIAMDQVRGGLSNWAKGWQESITEARIPEFRTELAPILRAATTTVRLTEPFRVVLTGPPNVGKSSLLNALVGFDRSITLDMAGTTRDVLHANTVISGLPIQFSDTAGIRDQTAAETIELEGMRQARLAAESADLLLLVCQPLPQGGYSKLESPSPDIPQLRVLNKIDLRLPHQPAGQFDASTNALTGEGLAELMVTIGSRLGEYLPDSGKPALLNERQWKIMDRSSIAACPEQISELLGHLIGHNHG